MIGIVEASQWARTFGVAVDQVRRGLARRGVITAHACLLLHQLTGSVPHLAELQELPQITVATWHDRLAHQTGRLIPASEALDATRQAVGDALAQRNPDAGR